MKSGIKMFVINILCFCCIHAFSQIVHDKNFRHWEHVSDGCVRYFQNDLYCGFLINANRLDTMEKAYLTNLIFSMLDRKDNLEYEDVDSVLIDTFENMLVDTLNSNKNIVTFAPGGRLSDYIRQYTAFRMNNHLYLFVGFHEDDTMKEDSLFFHLVYSRAFLYKHIQWCTYDEQFFLCYDCEKKEITFVYFDQKLGKQKDYDTPKSRPIE